MSDKLFVTSIILLSCWPDAARSGEPLAPTRFLDSWEEVLKDSRTTGGRWARAEYDFDDRGFNVLHFMGHSPLPYGMSLWGFVDFEGADTLGANREDTARYFLELDLKKKLWDSGGILAEVNDLHGDDNAIGRFGVFWKPDTTWLLLEDSLLAGKFDFAIKYFPVETDYQGGQFSFNWNKQFDEFMSGRVSAGGFFDLNYNIGPTGKNILVTEHQIRFRVAEGLHLITEFRVNEFLRDDFGIAPGIQYRF